ncbi:type II secretion system F family protein [Methanobrevibacter sp. TMH8]|uniref:type II secretion system F family protein n=1 Tax=Methanobrevibacter sp. TMH8 TaxID=2848611 RepID=UPI001CCE03D8|nr:type II secretion system F family protein [Methanobrevibacter sp. TMH8]MBZ9569974.1 type II secretion system F family protein [Methanobrevibacter sp. TMH8]
MESNELIIFISAFIEKRIPEKYLTNFQEILLVSGIFTVASELLAIIIIAIIILSFLSLLFSILFSFNIFLCVLFAFFIPPGILIGVIIIKSEKRSEKIENASPDFLRQLASMLRVGLSFENAMEDLSRYGSGPLYDEIKRAVIEIKMGREFNESIIAMVKRLKSKNLERTFKIILEARKSGGSLADIIDDISNDLRAIIMLKRERRSSVMMAVMFLVISAVIAAPFALGMTGIYSSFMTSLGKGSELVETSNIAAGAYIIIHSILASLIIGLVMYGDFKKGIKFSIPLTISAYGVFYIVSNFGSAFLNF